jgi:hypothetical protein
MSGADGDGWLRASGWRWLVEEMLKRADAQSHLYSPPLTDDLESRMMPLATDAAPCIQAHECPVWLCMRSVLFDPVQADTSEI